MSLETTPIQPRGRTLAIGFGSTVAMWAVAYVSMMKPGLVVGELLFVITLGCLLIGGILAGRTLEPGEEAWPVGLRIGLVSAALNLLLIGSLFSGKTGIDKLIHGWSWFLGLFGVSIALGIIGAALGAVTRSAAPRPDAAPRNWLFGFVCVAAGTVLLLLITGGFVTGLKAGLAVPDWPNSFGHNMLLYPLSEMVGGIFYEHAHRLYGMLVGVTAITLAVTIGLLDQRKWVRWIACIYLGMVIVQGVMGGLRVEKISTSLAIVHGVFAQIVFTTVMCLAAFVSTTWMSDRKPAPKPSAGTDRRYSLILVIMLIIQLGLGATYRHMQRAMEDPPQPLHVLLTHILVAALVTLLVIFVAGRAWGLNREQPVLPALGRALLFIVGFQVVLGVGAMLVVWMSDPHLAPPVHEVVITTAHQITGALLLACSTLLMLWNRRLLAE